MTELPTPTETMRRIDRARISFANFRGEARFRGHAERSGERVCSQPHDTAEVRGGQPCAACKAVV